MTHHTTEKTIRQATDIGRAFVATLIRNSIRMRAGRDKMEMDKKYPPADSLSPHSPEQKKKSQAGRSIRLTDIVRI